jgi:hypothetical protein
LSAVARCELRKVAGHPLTVVEEAFQAVLYFAPVTSACCDGRPLSLQRAAPLTQFKDLSSQLGAFLIIVNRVGEFSFVCDAVNYVCYLSVQVPDLLSAGISDPGSCGPLPA